MSFCIYLESAGDFIVHRWILVLWTRVINHFEVLKINFTWFE